MRGTLQSDYAFLAQGSRLHREEAGSPIVAEWLVLTGDVAKNQLDL
jgi:hypothetical protein